MGGQGRIELPGSLHLNLTLVLLHQVNTTLVTSGVEGDWYGEGRDTNGQKIPVLGPSCRFSGSGYLSGDGSVPGKVR